MSKSRNLELVLCHMCKKWDELDGHELTGSLNISIFGTVPTLFPAFNVSPVHGLASTMFSFFLSRTEPMLSHPFVGPDEDVGGDSLSASEKMAIFAFFGREFVAVDAVCCDSCGLSLRRVGANGSILAASAARTFGNAGDDGSSAPAGRASHRCLN